MRATTTRRLRSLLLLSAALFATSATTGTARAADPAAPHASTPAERQARGEAAARAFVMGRYDEALATYTDLYIQSDGRPEYLRNIGRCQQKLKQYARAIDSFKEYLRRAKRLSADEKKEVQGFITEMETAQANESGAAATPAPARPAPPATTAPAPAPVTPAPAPPPPSIPAPLPYAAPPATSYPPASPPSYPPAPPTPAPTPAGSTLGMNASASGGPPAAPNPYGSATPPNLITGSGTPEAAAKSSPLKPIGIATVVAAGAAAIGGTLMLVHAKSVYDQAKKEGCPFPGSTSCASQADSVSTANTVSKILYVAAGALGVAGVVMIAVAPAPAPDGRVGLAVSGRF